MLIVIIVLLISKWVVIITRLGIEKRKDYKKADWESIKCGMRTIDWDAQCVDKDCEEQWTISSNKVSDLEEKNIPAKIKCSCVKNSDG